MAFDKEPSGYKKSVLSDLQWAWQNLRDRVVEHAGFAGRERALLRIDEGMSWESVKKPPVYEQMSAPGAQYSCAS